MNPTLRYALSACILTTLAGCGQTDSDGAKPAKQLAPPEETGVLEVATRNGSTTYYLDRHENPIGPEYSLITRFAESKGWQVQWTMHDSTAEVLKALESGATHIAAAGLTHLPSRTERFTQGPAHTEITEQLVCHREMRPLPRKPEALAGVGITVTADSSYVETLNSLAAEHEGIEFNEDDGRTTGMPADLLAALSYQESHWDPAAVSPTGVRGIMMLPQNTAQSLGVTDRLDPVAAIDGGARYLADRHQRLPDTIPEPDRTFLALASYNIGRGHLLDARQLARDLGKNPDSWDDMKEVLPLKADKRYYPQTRYGYARGYEPVHYVQRIRNYRDVISVAFE